MAYWWWFMANVQIKNCTSGRVCGKLVVNTSAVCDDKNQSQRQTTCRTCLICLICHICHITNTTLQLMMMTLPLNANQRRSHSARRSARHLCVAAAVATNSHRVLPVFAIDELKTLLAKMWHMTNVQWHYWTRNGMPWNAMQWIGL